MRKEQEIFLSQQVAELRGITIEGFKHVNEHLKQLNGKVAEHERRLNQTDLANAEEKGEKKGMSMAKKAILTAIGIAIAIIGLFASSGCWGIINCHK